MKVSIIVPIYNVEKYLAECLDSLVNQTYKNIEIIAVIDGTKDNSEEIAINYQKKDDRIRIFSRSENKGLLATRQEGLTYAIGDYVTFVDSDDWIALNMVEKMIEIAEKTGSEIVKCGYCREFISKQEFFHVIDHNKTIYKNQFQEEFYPTLLETTKFNNICTELIRRNIINIDEIDTSVSMGEDLLFNLHLYPKIASITLLEECYYHYRYNEESITTSISLNKTMKNFEDLIIVNGAVEKLIKSQNNEALNQLFNTRMVKFLWDQSIRLVSIKEINRKKTIQLIKERLNTSVNIHKIESDSIKDKIIAYVVLTKKASWIYWYAKLVIYR